MNKLCSYADFLHATNAQPAPQHLLFVFARAELPGSATLHERQRFVCGQGGVFTPVVCVDKLREALS